MDVTPPPTGIADARQILPTQMNGFAKARWHDTKWHVVGWCDRLLTIVILPVYYLLLWKAKAMPDVPHKKLSPIVLQPTNEHEGMHGRIGKYVGALIERYRGRVGLDVYWSIEVRVLCPGEMVEHDADIWWQAELWVARVCVRCDLHAALLKWVVIHELYELQDWGQAQAAIDLVNQIYPESNDMRETYLDQTKRARNQAIEQRVAALLGHRRPYVRE